MADLPGVVSYGTVTGTFLKVVADGNDANDLPDAVPMSGAVTFTCSAKKIVAGGKIIVPTAIAVALDEGGSFSVKLVATDDPDTNPSAFTYTVSTNFGIDSFPMALPQGTVVDLAAAAPVGASGGVLISRGEKGDTGPQGPQGVPGTGGSGGVTSLNGSTGALTLNAGNLAETTTAKVLTSTERTQIAAAAARATDAQLRDRSTHTGTQPMSTISDSGSVGRNVLAADSWSTGLAALGIGNPVVWVDYTTNARPTLPSGALLIVRGGTTAQAPTWMLDDDWYLERSA